jgi:hypothetical protein
MAAGLDGKLWSQLTELLRKDPSERPSSAHLVKERLTEWLSTRGGARDLSMLVGTQVQAPRRRPSVLPTSAPLATASLPPEAPPPAPLPTPPPQITSSASMRSSSRVSAPRGTDVLERHLFTHERTSGAPNMLDLVDAVTTGTLDHAPSTSAATRSSTPCSSASSASTPTGSSSATTCTSRAWRGSIATRWSAETSSPRSHAAPGRRTSRDASARSSPAVGWPQTESPGTSASSSCSTSASVRRT